MWSRSNPYGIMLPSIYIKRLDLRWRSKWTKEIWCFSFDPFLNFPRPFSNPTLLFNILPRCDYFLILRIHHFNQEYLIIQANIIANFSAHYGRQFQGCQCFHPLQSSWVPLIHSTTSSDLQSICLPVDMRIPFLQP